MEFEKAGTTMSEKTETGRVTDAMGNNSERTELSIWSNLEGSEGEGQLYE